MYDYLIVGAGFAGCTLAERLAAGLNKRVLLIEKRGHVGGNAFDFYDEHNILVHRYGPHIFHTNIQRVWEYLSQFTEWYRYEHKVLASVDGKKVPFPVNLDTVNMVFGLNLSEDELEPFLEKLRRESGVGEIKNAADMAISRVGRELYELFFKNYTKKQWDLWPEELAAEVTARIPVRLDRDPRYFTDEYQGLPLHGYTPMFENMLKHPNIDILLNTDYKSVTGDIKFAQMIYTGPIDCFFDYMHGHLPYRSLRFESETLDQEQFQETGTVNYPNDHDFTRITEFKHLTGQTHPKTSIMREYPIAEGEPYYPIPRKENQELYAKYEAEAKKLEQVYFVGRLAEYRYYNMDAVVDRALSVFDEIAGGARGGQ